MKSVTQNEESESVKTEDTDSGKSSAKNFVRLSVNLGVEPMETLRTLAESQGLSITDSIRRAIKIWKFIQDQIEKGNEIAVVEPDGSIKKVLVL